MRRCPVRSRSLAILVLLCVAPAWALDVGALTSDEAFSDAARLERSRLQQERQALESDFRAREQACFKRFFVNACTRDVQEDKRQALAALRAREQALELAERQRRLDAALVRAAARQQEQAGRVSGPAQPATEPERRQRELEAVEQERARRDAEAASRAAQRKAREAEAQVRRQAREEELRRRPAPPAMPDPSARP